MAKGIIGKKIGMTQVFAEDGNIVPVTVIDVNGCVVVGKRTADKDKYTALVLGFGDVKEKALTRAQLTAAKKAGAPLRKHTKEFRVSDADVGSANVGDAVTPDLFKKGELVDVRGITKGRGFQGVMKRWNFAGFRATHGTHEYRRHPGAIGQRKTPGRVYPNKKLPGHYGVETVSIQNLSVVDVDVEKGLLLVKGSVPGHINALVYVRPSVKAALRAAHKAASGKK